MSTKGQQFEFVNDTRILSSKIFDFIKKYYESGELDVEFDKSPDGRQQKTEYNVILDKLYTIFGDIQYLQLPLRDSAVLHYDNTSGRLMYGSEELHCGEVIEVLIDRWNEGELEWYCSRLEFFDESEHTNGWYIVDKPDLPLDGLQARRRDRR